MWMMSTCGAVRKTVYRQQGRAIHRNHGSLTNARDGCQSSSYTRLARARRLTHSVWHATSPHSFGQASAPNGCAKLIDVQTTKHHVSLPSWKTQTGFSGIGWHAGGIRETPRPPSRVLAGKPSRPRHQKTHRDNYEQSARTRHQPKGILKLRGFA